MSFNAPPPNTQPIPTQPAQQPEPQRRRWVPWVGAAAALLVGVGIGQSSGDTTITAIPPRQTITQPGETVTAPGPTVTQEVTAAAPAKTVTVTAEPPAPETAFGEGDWVVGEDIKAGKYKTAEPVSDFCYWGIYRGGTNHDDIIQNNTVTGGIPRVTLRSGQEFSSSGCGDWVKAS